MAKTDNIATFRITPSQMGKALLGMWATKRAAFFWGPPGIAKSAIAQTTATALGVAFIDVRLSQMDPTDLRGIPFPTDEGGLPGVEWSAPLVLPRDIDIQSVRDIEATPTIIRFYNPLGSNNIHYCPDPSFVANAIGPDSKNIDVEILAVEGDRAVVVAKRDGEAVAAKIAWSVTGKVRGLIALEEFNSAPQSVQAAAYQLVLDRRLGNYIVPDDVYMVAMGNRDQDKGVTFKMPTPIMNRFVHFELEVNFDDWQTWALESFVHPHIVGFLTAFTEQLHIFNPGTAARGFPTPRSWEFVSDILRENEHTMEEEVLRAAIIGAIGDAAGLQFMEFRKVAQDLPKVEDILTGKLTRLPMKEIEPSLAFALTTTMCYRLKAEADDMYRKHNGCLTPADRKAMKMTEDFAKWTVRADNFLSFILHNFKPELSILGAKSSLAVHRLPFDATKMKYFEIFADKFKDFILPDQN